MTVKVPLSQPWPSDEPDDPFEFRLTMSGTRSDDFALEITTTRPPETIPRLVEISRTLAALIERSNFEVDPVRVIR